MQVLLVEDEEHKIKDLSLRIERWTGSAPTIASSVREAVLSVLANDFSLIVLDMALPTFSKNSSVEGGVAQPVGGVEVLRALESAGKRSNVIVVTQYPEIFIGGEKVRLSQIAKITSKRYRQNVVGAVLYSFNTPEWEKAFEKLLKVK